MQDDTDYSTAPVSINELKANKAGKASLWTPRDALLAALRDLDSGKINPDVLFVGYSEPVVGEPGVVFNTNYYAAADDLRKVTGVLAILLADKCR